MMKQIFRVAVKDFRIQFRSILNYLLVSIVMIVGFTLIGVTQKQMIYAILGFTVIYGFVNKALYEDEKNNTLRLLVSLPLKRDVIVYGRYLSTAIFIIVLSLLMFLLSVFTDLIAYSAYEPAILIILAATSAVMVLMLAIYLPLAFKLGYIRAAGINRFLFLGVFAFFGAVSFALTGVMKGKSPDYFQKLDMSLSGLNPALILVVLIIFSLLVFLLSMAISVKLFRKRLLF